MNKNELVSLIATKTKFTKKDSEVTLNGIIESIEEALKSGEKITILGFGTFLVKERSERNGINPRTKEKMVIPATKVPMFRFGTELKDIVKNNQ